MGYFAWEFFDKESNLLPFTVGTYVGTKKVLNLGAGFYYHPDATATQTGTEFKRYNTLLVSADIFADIPLNKEKGTAITAYGVFYNFDFGANYIRSVGIMNVGTGDPTGGLLTQGAGNAQFTIGSGNIAYLETGLLLPKKWGGKVTRIQPFGTFTYKDMSALKESSTQWGVGVNFFLEGHHSKISLKYQTRPLYDNSPLANEPGLNPDKKYAGEFIIQTMIYL